MTMPRTGGNSQDRRRSRRAADRRYARSLGIAARAALTESDLADFAQLALEAAGSPTVEAPETLAPATGCECGHAASEHLDGDGPCTFEDGRGTCSCGAYAEMKAEASIDLSDLVEAAVAAACGGPDSGDVVRALLQSHAAVPTSVIPTPGEIAQMFGLQAFGVGDVPWGQAHGFTALLAEVNAFLAALSYDDGKEPQFTAIDAGVQLDKVLIVDAAKEYYVAGIEIDGAGETVLAPQDQWVTVAAPFADAPLPDEHQPGSRLPEANPSPGAPELAAEVDGLAWNAVFVPEGRLTDDGRAFAPGSLTWRELPLTLMAMLNTSAQGGHDGALVSGRIDQMWRDGSLIRASGVFDEGEYGQEIGRMVGDGVLRGLSVDIAIHEYETGPRSAYFNPDGTWRDDREPVALVEGAEFDVADGDDPMIFVVTKGVIGMATVCPFPAFAEANVSLAASGATFVFTHQGRFEVLPARAPEVKEEALVASATTLTMTGANGSAIFDANGSVIGWLAAPQTGGDVSLVAAAADAPLAPPADWFADPQLSEATALTIDEDGRIYGHAWTWDSCHIAFPNRCVTAPHSLTDYEKFHLGAIECEDGTVLAVGKVTLDAPHAGPRASLNDATAHYDHTGTVAAHVRVGEDEFGGWVAGAICPQIGDEKLRILRGAALSGDWRNLEGNLELVALLAVNVPGFPVPRPRALVASGAEGEEVLSLTAAAPVLQALPAEAGVELPDLDDLVSAARG